MIANSKSKTKFLYFFIGILYDKNKFLNGVQVTPNLL